jgi:hypothetical protein
MTRAGWEGVAIAIAIIAGLLLIGEIVAPYVTAALNPTPPPAS